MRREIKNAWTPAGCQGLRLSVKGSTKKAELDDAEGSVKFRGGGAVKSYHYGSVYAGAGPLQVWESWVFGPEWRRAQWIG